MEFSVTQAQFTTLKNAMGAQVVAIYALDPISPSQVGRIALLDPKLGGAAMGWASASEAPTEAEFLLLFPGAVKVEAIA